MALTSTMGVALREQTLRSAAMDAASERSLSSNADAQACRLATSVGRGDETAFRELYDRYHQRLFRLAVVLSRGDEVMAHEVVQLTMLTAAAKLRPVETEEHLWHWLARVAHQHLIKEWRHRGREPIMVDLTELPETADLVEPDAVLEQSLVTALLGLEEPDRQIIEWFYYDGLSQKEIAARLKTTPKAVSSRLERARAKLRLSLTRIISHET